MLLEHERLLAEAIDLARAMPMEVYVPRLYHTLYRQYGAGMYLRPTCLHCGPRGRHPLDLAREIVETVYEKPEYVVDLELFALQIRHVGTQD